MAGAETELFMDFSIILIVAALIILLFHRLRLPIVLGYLLAGILIGPYVTFFPTVQNIPTIDALADLAIIVIMFSLGLSFSFSKLRSTGLVATVAGTVVIVSMIVVGYTLGLAMGWRDVDSFFLGSMIAISSTAVITKGIMDRQAKGERSSQIVMGILIVEDLAVVVILTLISGISATGELQVHGLLLTIINVGLFVLLFLAFGFLIAPRLANYAAGTGSRELLLMTAMGLCFGFALLGYLVGFSPAIGAFVAGAVLGELPQRGRIIEQVRPVRDVFAAVFFISIGMLLDPSYLVDYWLPAVVVAAVFIIAKMTLSTGATFLSGTSARTALQVGLMMAVMGEFSYIIAREGSVSGVLSDFLYPTIVVASMLTIVVGTTLTRGQGAIIGSLERRTPVSVKRYLAFITLTINQVRSRAAVSSRISESAREDVKEIVLDVVVILTAILALRFGLAYSSDILSAIGLEEGLLRTFELAMVLVALIFIITALVALTRRVIHLVREAALPIQLPEGRRRSLKATVAYQTMRALLSMVAIVGGTLLVVFIAAPYTPTPVLLLALVSMALVIVFVFERSVASFNERFKLTLREGLRSKGEEEVEPPPPPLPDRDIPVTEILRQGDSICNLVVGPGSSDSGRYLGETALWNRPDVAILAIRRDEGLIIDPSDEERLRNGDVLIYLEGCRPQEAGGSGGEDLEGGGTHPEDEAPPGPTP